MKSPKESTSQSLSGRKSVKEKFSKDMGVDAIPDNNDVYEKFIEWYGGVDFVQGVLDNFVWEMDD